MNFSDFLKKYRIENGLTKKQTAALMGWTPMYYGRFENGNILPSKKNIEKFCANLNIPIENLLPYINHSSKECNYGE